MKIKQFWKFSFIVFLSMFISCNCNSLSKLYDKSREGFLFVNQDASASPADGSDWDHAFRTFEEAIAAAENGKEIWVAGGNYILTSNLVINGSVKIYGGFKGYEKIRSDRDFQVNPVIITTGTSCNVQITDGKAVLDGLVLVGGDRDLRSLAITGGKPVIRNCCFGIQSGSAGSGVVVSGAKTTCSIVNCTFRNIPDNSMIYVGPDGDCIIEGGSFSGNTFTNFSASPIRVNTAGTCKITGCTINNNEDCYHGGIFISNGNCEITDCIISNNGDIAATTRTITGGGIRVENSGTCMIVRSTIEGNSAQSGASGSGGGISLDTNGICRIIDSKIKDNYARTWGAGISILGTGLVEIRGCTISGNYLTDGSCGGGIFADCGSTVVMKDSIVSGNKATQNGGGIDTAGKFAINNSTISGNDAAFNGGGIAVAANCECTISNGTTISGNTSSNGLGIYSKGTLLISDSAISNNVRMMGSAAGGGLEVIDGNTTIINCSINNNEADVGGGIYIISSSAVVNIDRCRIYANTTSAIFNFLGSVSVSNTLFQGNNSNDYGGALYTFNAKSSMVVNCTFMGNTALTAGNSVYADSGDLDLYNCIFNDGNNSVESDVGNMSYCWYEDASYVGGGITINAPSCREGGALFLSNYQLASTSDCVGRGTRSISGYTFSTLDLAGNARVQKGTIDIGAYESAF